MDRPMNLTETDFNILIEAMDEWTQKGLMGNLMGGLMGSLIAKDDLKAREAFAAEESKRKAQYNNERQYRQEVATLLKAKLIMLKRELQSLDYPADLPSEHR